MIKNMFCKYKKQKLLNIVSKEVGQAELIFALNSFGFCMALGIKFIVIGHNHMAEPAHQMVILMIVLLGLYMIGSLINFLSMLNIRNGFYQKDHELNVNHFIQLMKLHDYTGAKKLVNKNGWEIIIDQNELENNVKKYQRSNETKV